MNVTKKKTVKLIVWSVVGLAVAGTVGFNIYTASTYIPTVKSGTISHQSIDAFLSTTATIKATDSTAYFAPPNSRVQEVFFQKGDTVRAGDVIATFDLSDLNDQIRLAELSYADAQVSYRNAQVDYENAQLSVEDAEEAVDRQSELDEINALLEENQAAISNLHTKIRKLEREMEEGESTDDKEQMDKYTSRIDILTQESAELSAKLSSYPQIANKERGVQNSLNNLEARQNGIQASRNAMETAAVKLNSLRKYQENGSLVAEKDGIITELSLVAGAPSSDAATAVSIQNLDSLRACFNINKYDISVIHEGQAATLTLGDAVYQGVISKIGTSAVEVTSGSTKSSQVPAEITISNADDGLILGLEFDVDIHTYSNPDALAAPVEAILTDREGDFCYLLVPSEKEGAFTYTKTYVQVGKSSDQYIEILGGIDDGAQVILNPPTTLESMPLVRALPDGAMMAAGGAAGGSLGAAPSGAGEPEAGEPAASSEAAASPGEESQSSGAQA